MRTCYVLRGFLITRGLLSPQGMTSGHSSDGVQVENIAFELDCVRASSALAETGRRCAEHSPLQR